MASPTFFTRGHTPTLTDTNWFILQRILGALNDISSSGVTGLVMLGLVDPEGVVSAAEGTPYLNTALKTFWIKQGGGSGNTGWTPQLI